MDTILVLEGSEPDVVQGNLLVDYLLGVEVRFASSRLEQLRMSREAVAEARAEPSACRTTFRCSTRARQLPIWRAPAKSSSRSRRRGSLRTASTCPRPARDRPGHVLAQKLLGGFRVRGVTATDEFDIPPCGADDRPYPPRRFRRGAGHGESRGGRFDRNSSRRSPRTRRRERLRKVHRRETDHLPSPADGGQGSARRRGDFEPARGAIARLPEPGADGVPGSVLLAQSEDDGGRDRRGAAPGA